jgi:hypothetical protein
MDFNQIMQLANQARQSGNPMGFFQSMAQNNPVIGEAFNRIQGRDPMQVAQELAREKGVDINAFRKVIGF